MIGRMINKDSRKYLSKKRADPRKREYPNSLRNEFRKSLNERTNIELLLMDNNVDYIKWLERKIESYENKPN